MNHPLPPGLPFPITGSFAGLIRDVPDFPRAGVLFKDITPLLENPAAFAEVIAQLAARLRPHAPTALVAIESRGFLFGAPLALALGLPLVLVRKPGKLPRQTQRVDYALEYGVDVLEIHADAVSRGGRYAIVDDVLATGGTAAAVARLLEELGGTVACHAFLIELSFLAGRARLGTAAVESLVAY